MLIMGFNGTEINEYSPVAQWLSNDGLGGVILFDKDISSNHYGKNLIDQGQIKHLIHELKWYASKSLSSDKEVPLFVALDYEGGRCRSLKYY